MIFPEKSNSITFQLNSSTPAIFSFPTKKPKRIFFDSSVNDYSFRIKINGEDSNNMLLHISRNSQFRLTFPMYVNSLEFTSTAEGNANLGIFIEEWGN